MKNKAKSQPKQRFETFDHLKPVLFWALLGLFSIALVLHPLGDVDIWWHITMGKGMVAHHWLPPATDFYWSPVAYEIPGDLRFTWLGDLLMALIFEMGGSIGLQMLALGSVALCLWFLWDIADRAYSGRNLLILLLFIAGTYQMQIVRNALFGLPGTVGLLWLWWRIQTQNQRRLWWVIPPLLGIWSCLHGTYLFGFGLLLFLVIGNVLDRIRTGQSLTKRDFLIRAGVLFLSYGSIALYNPFTWNTTKLVLDLLSRNIAFVVIAGVLGSAIMVVLLLKRAQNPKLVSKVLYFGLLGGGGLIMLRHFWPYLSDSEFLKSMNLRAYRAQVNIEELGLLGRLKHGFNNTFWKSDVQQMASLDFYPPFDFYGDIYVWSSLLMLILAITTLVLRAHRNLVDLLPLAVITFLGLGYVRTVGFLAIFSAYLLMITSTRQRQKHLARFAWPASALLVVLALVSSLSSANPLGLFADHQLRLGHAAYFPKDLAKATRDQYPEALVFTTIENGGFILNQWYPHKKVFMDGFFRPHEGQTFLDYTHAMESKDPEYLYERYGLTLAIIGIRDSSWFQVFNSAPGWVPRMADRGAILFERISTPPSDYQFDLLLTPTNLADAPDYLQTVLAMRLYDVGFKLLSEGLMIQAVALLESDEPLSQKLRARVPKNIRDPFRKSVAHLQSQYGLVNDPLIRSEFALSEAIQNGDQSAILKHGEALVVRQPLRQDVWQALIHTANQMGRSDLVETYQKRRAEAAADANQEPP